jgi:hypothetical protein
MGNELVELAESAYRGEVRGQVLFGAMAVALPEHADELEALRLLEVQTGEAARRLVERLDGDATPKDDDRVVGRQLADASIALPWTEFLALFAPTTTNALINYRRLRELVDEGDRSVADELIAHEEALQAFADASLAGDANPIAVVVERLRDPWRSEVPSSLTS